MKNILLILIGVFGVFTSVDAQKYYTKTGKTSFEASVETFEPVKATNKSTTAILNVETGEVASLLFVKSFQFKVALMQEHFNENYMDSDKYPKATFKGKISDFVFNEITESPKEYNLDGRLTIRGKSQQISDKITLSRKGSLVMVEINFSVEPEDFGIEIPSIVRNKIAKSIKVSGRYELQEKG